MSRLNHLTTSSKRTWCAVIHLSLPRGTNVLTPKQEAKHCGGGWLGGEGCRFSTNSVAPRKVIVLYSTREAGQVVVSGYVNDAVSARKNGVQVNYDIIRASSAGFRHPVDIYICEPLR